MISNDELMMMRHEAKKVVTRFVATTSASCAVPIPIADAVLLFGEQIAMMTAISEVYKLEIGKDSIKSLFWGALGISGASILGKSILSNAFKLIPGLGTVVGSAISAGTAGTLTYAFGNAFIKLCEAIKNGEIPIDAIDGEIGKVFFRRLVSQTKTENTDCDKGSVSFERPEGKGYGIIKKACAIVKNGKSGKLVWDYLVFNEISFLEDKTQESESLFMSWSDEKAELEYERLSKLYSDTVEETSREISISGLDRLKEMDIRAKESLQIRYGNKLVGYLLITKEKANSLTITDFKIVDDFCGKGIYSIVIGMLRDMYVIELSDSVKSAEKEWN